MAYKILFFAVVLALVVGVVFSQSILTQYCAKGPGGTGEIETLTPWYCQNVDPAIISSWKRWAPIGLLVVTLSYTLAALLFMLGVALRNDRLRTFGMAEIYEATATALMIVLFGFISAVMFGLLPSLTVGTINPFDSALNYIALTINTTYITNAELFNLGTLAGMYGSISLGTGESGIAGVSVPNIFPAFAFVAEYEFFWPTFLVVAFMFEAMLSLYTQFYLIIFFMYAAIPVFLIPGMIFRALIPTRHLGGMLMAMAIGFYFIMPVLFSVAYHFTSANIIAQLDAVQTAINRYGTGSNAIASIVSPTSPLAVTLGNLENSGFSSFWLSILFFPALIVAMTYALITQIAEILGGLAKGSGRLRGLV